MLMGLFESGDYAVITLLTIALLLLAAEFGFRIGRHMPSTPEEPTRAVVLTVQGAILGLLGLLLGFTFAMAVSRYDARRELVVEESNAIGAAFLRASLLPEPHRSDVRRSVRRYVDSRLAFYRAGDAARRRAAKSRTAELQARIWADAAELMRQDRQANSTALFIRSLNSVIRFQGARETALESHVPVSVLVLLWVVAAVALGSTGYATGFSARRDPFSMLVLPLLVTAVLLVVFDLDRPRRGLILEGYESMVELRTRMEEAGEAIPTPALMPAEAPTEPGDRFSG